MTKPFLAVENLVVDYHVKGGTFRAVDDVSFSVDKGKTIAVVGESGCGKSTIAKALMRLVTPTSGRIDLDGTDLAALSESRLRPLRSKFQMVFQDPYGSLDPHMTAQEIVAEPLKLQGVRSKAERHKAAAELIDQVGLPVRSLDKHPAEFSGGQRQRIGIARALASKPELLVCDEATSALDVSVQAQVLRLLKSIQDETGITYVFISHNLGVVQEISDSVMVMQRGKLVEHGTTASVLTAPKEDYTRKLRRAALDPATMVGLKPRHLVRSLALSNQA
ncbi:ATP-binding cassette domain-containing protein [Pseudarthrobacter sulfonivorans]|uniref:ATP-binding cassette domain-containing protein n=1 Tax=Pseudarthrobacter sulfonivorans TaxID=121292 RepID=UPI00277E8825|nr:ATP-binding cassette domain-containing protein [Pseudarthrobacter sulfonivorans]MDP9998227.1 peptide/nickel transport system ATP-binding protein [Pseudarthrobacter sulfonivorans]